MAVESGGGAVLGQEVMMGDDSMTFPADWHGIVGGKPLMIADNVKHHHITCAILVAKLNLH